MNANATKPLVSYDDVMKLDIKVCIILHAERIPKKDRLLKLLVGGLDGKFEAITNLGKDYEPEDLINKSFPFILNLEPTNMAGVESEGMIMAGDTHGRMEKIQLLDMSNTMPIGTTIL
jgi:methionyl-tRNA synthetase